jgi:hypothetical protein
MMMMMMDENERNDKDSKKDNFKEQKNNIN